MFGIDCASGDTFVSRGNTNLSMVSAALIFLVFEFVSMYVDCGMDAAALCRIHNAWNRFKMAKDTFHL